MTRDWENYVQQNNEDKRKDLERQRLQYTEGVRRDVKDLRFRNSNFTADLNAAMSGTGRNERMAELDARASMMQYQEPPTPPASEPRTPTDSNILRLQRQIEHQGDAINGLKLELQSEKAKVRQLQTERHEAVSARRDAILNSTVAENERLKAQVSGLDELLDESRQREKELERRMEEENAKEQNLRSQLQSAQRRVRELEDSRAIHPHLQETPGLRRNEKNVARALESGVISEEQRRQQQEVLGRLRDCESELGSMRSTVYAPSSRASGRSRKQERQMSENGFVSVSKASGRHVRLNF